MVNTGDLRADTRHFALISSQRLARRVTVYHYRTQQIHALDVADPYARALTADGARCIFVDLDGDAALMPPKWRQHETPALEGMLPVRVDELVPRL